jgi:radical SAM superfamily enzyme YgiQ (UPF0313 family)
MRVALVQSPVWWTIDPPLGLAQMAGCALQYGHDVRVFDLNILFWKDRPPKYQNLWLWEQFHFWNNPEVVSAFFEDNRALIDRYVDDILRTDAPVVCFSVALGAQISSGMLARLIKERDPKRLVVMGGQYFFHGDRVKEMLDAGADVVIRGAGDLSFPRLLADVARTGAPEARPGLVFRRGRKTVDGGEAWAPRDLDGVPFADYTRFPMELYEDRNRIPIAASRGCVWACRFCSTREFWPTYSYMSGERIYAEVLYHRRLFPERFHVEFYDITANGKPESLSRFSDLVIENESRTGWKHLKWKINAIIRPEMTADLLGKMSRANCQDIIYGIESGSARVLKLMNKHYKPEIAERVLRDTHAAGIKAIGNFMFGFPGETEEDFRMTLDFLRRNRESFDRVYASATFTSLEEHSYLTENQSEFSIAKRRGKHHSLYWQSDDGSNNYLVRLDRYRRFRELAIELGIDAYKGVNGALELDHRLNTANYYHYNDQPVQALFAYLRYLDIDPMNEAVWGQLEEFQAAGEVLSSAIGRLRRADKPGARRLLRKVGFYKPGVRTDRKGRPRLAWGKDLVEDLPTLQAALRDFLARRKTFLDRRVGESARGAAV